MTRRLRNGMLLWAVAAGMVFAMCGGRNVSAAETVARGWVFFAPYRRGQGLSGDAGPYIMDEVEAARKRGGEALGAETMVRILSTEQLQDQMAALGWLQKQAFVRSGRIAVMGNSFGGSRLCLGRSKGGTARRWMLRGIGDVVRFLEALRT